MRNSRGRGERMEAGGDRVDRLMAQWQRQRPDLDHGPLAVIGRITLLAHLLAGELDRTYAAYGTNAGGFDVLAALRRSGPPHRLSPTALFQQLLISSGGMTHRVDKLEAAGLVERLPDPTDRRSLLVGLTPRGLALIDEAIAVHLANEERLLADLAPHQREELAGLLRRLVRSLDRLEPAPPFS
jgi:DNA-binding MarR family transcriptional regulator